MTTASRLNDLTARQRDAADHASTVFGMKTWVANAYAQIVTSTPKDNHSATPTLRACTKLVQDDSGSVDPLVRALAQEVLRLNQASVALAPNNEATMHTVLDLLGMKYAEPEEKHQLLAALSGYLKNHDFADDGHFSAYRRVVDADTDPSV